MSTKGARDYRPSFHYAPKKGWINDPNGLVYDGEVYHLFAQHHPHDTVWGPMHWLHATSKDLVHWQELGIALEPDELGYIFSGSAVIDAGNTSGLGDGSDPLVAIFTSHGECEQQSIAYSNDGGLHFTKYAGNPVITNPGVADFRDPKVFWNEAQNCWNMVLSAADRVAFYRSEDLIHWTRTGDFGALENKLPGVFECPDLFPLIAPDGSILWALLVSIGRPAEVGGNRVQYFLGEFDGDTFRQTIPFDKPELIDYGYDNYAAVSYSGIEERLLVGWGTSPTYAAQTPTNEYCCCMTLARRVSLVNTDVGIRLAFEPVIDVPSEEKAITSGDGLPGEAFVLNIWAEGVFEARLLNGKGECFRFGLNEAGKFYTDRSASGEMEFNTWYSDLLYQHTSQVRVMTGAVEMTLVFDRSIAELYADQGTYVNTSVMYPTQPYEYLEICGASANVAILQI